MVGKTVTITLKASDHYTSPPKPLFKEGERVKLARDLWEHTQMAKNRRMVFRMLKKDYWPYANIRTIIDSDFETTLTLSPFRF